jgi:hypothetical protein
MSNELSVCLRKAVCLEAKIPYANQFAFRGSETRTLRKKEAPVTRGFLKDVA